MGLMAAVMDILPISSSLLLLLSLLPLSFLLLLRHRRSPKLPPSPPWNLPFLGHIYLLHRFYTPSFVLHQRRLLGPVFSLRFGSVTTIFVTSAQLTHEALVQKSTIFSSRVHSPSIALLNFNFRDINSSNGAYWRGARKNLAQHTFLPATLQGFRATRERALEFLMSLLRRGEAGRVGAMEILRMAMLHSAISMCFGFTVDDEALIAKMSSTLEQLSAQFFPLAFSDYYTFLRPFLLPRLRRQTQSLLAVDRQTLATLLDQRQAKNLDLFPGNYVESLLQRMKDSSSTTPSVDATNDDTTITMEDVFTLTSEFLEVNTTTLATTVEWTMARLIKHPTVQEKLYRHISDVVGERPVQEDDLPNLPYLKAVVLETLRLHPPAPILLPRATTQKCEIGGYDIPRGAVVNFCVGAIAVDPEVWEDPREFRPERMIGVDLDITGTKSGKVRMLPFGAGRRFCPGMVIGRTNVEMAVARAVQEFEWLPSAEGVDFSQKLRLSVCLAKPLRPLLRNRRGE